MYNTDLHVVTPENLFSNPYNRKVVAPPGSAAERADFLPSEGGTCARALNVAARGCVRPLDAFHTTGYTRQTAGMRRRTEQSHVAGSLSVRRLEGGGGHVHRVRAHRHCAHQCSQGHRARGRTRCCTRTQSAVAHCTTTAPRCTQATMSSGTHSRGRCS